ncbi:MAG: hypothetical protein J7M10_01220, partial [Candidatus Cloacimonetes bacterium]|nr:hypothetical protein [Candidatus Cloacimonadota bacterium]
YALYKIGSLEVAEDIASQTIYSYLLKRDRIVNENHEGWIVNTSKNYCNQYFELKKKEDELHKSLKRNVAEELHVKINSSLDFLGQEKINISDAVNDAKDTLSKKELETYVFYLQCERNIKKMQRITKGSYPALKQKISRINRKIKAETFQKLGVIATKKIITPQINNVITKFLLRFKENLENNTLEKMYVYFTSENLEKYNPDFHIEKVLDYEVQLKDSIYSIHVVFTNKQGRDESFYFSFLVNNNYLKIVVPPTPHKTHYQISEEDGKRILELLDKYPEDSSGVHSFPDEELKLLKKLLGEDEE